MHFQCEQVFETRNHYRRSFNRGGFCRREQALESGRRHQHDIKIPTVQFCVIRRFELKKCSRVVEERVAATADNFDPDVALLFRHENVRILSASLKTMLDDSVPSDNKKTNATPSAFATQLFEK